MKTQTATQAAPMVPATLNLAPDSFTKELSAITGTDKLGWSPDDHISFVFKLIDSLKNDAGVKPSLNSEQEDRLRLIYRPLEDTQRKVLRQTFAEAGYKLSDEAEQTFVMMLSAGQFATFLSKTDNPATKKPFITVEKKKGAKKKTLTALISSSGESSASEAPPINTDTGAAPAAAAEEPNIEV